MRALVLFALFFLACRANASYSAVISSDEPEYIRSSTVVFKPAVSYEHALQVWKTPEDINAWIAANFSYDMERAIQLSESQRAGKERIPIYDPSEFFNIKTGICVDMSRFGVETLRRIDPGSDPKYLMVEFDPIQIRKNMLRRHWLVSFRRNGKTYLFADSKCPGHIAGPYNNMLEFIQEYEQFRGRKIVEFREMQSFRKQRQTQALKIRIKDKP